MKTIHRLLTDAPLISDGSLAAILTCLAHPVAAEFPELAKLREQCKPQIQMTHDGIAILPVEGVLAHKPDPVEMAFFGMEDSGVIQRAIESLAADSSVQGILLDIDSPGGFLTGGPEVADAVKAARKEKPVCSWTGGMMASLAYWIGSAADTVIASPSAIVGSIGVYTTHLDVSGLYQALGAKVEVIKNKEAAFKAIGIPGTSLTDEQRNHLQERIQAAFGEFRSAVKASRKKVSDDSMRGQTFTGREAGAANLVDGVGSRAYALSLLRTAVRKAK